MNKISLILPVYNVAPFLERCLMSIIPFLQKGHQMIIVNDGSTDNSSSIISHFMQSYQEFEIIYIEQTNGGLSAARNTGIEKATGDYLWFIDTDDWLDNRAINIVDGNILNQDVDLIVFGRYEHFQNKSIPIPSHLVSRQYDNGIQYFEDSIRRGDYRTQVWDKIFKVSLIERCHLRFTEGMLYEDMYFMLQVLVNAQLTIQYPLYVYNYNQMNNTSISKTVRKKDLDILGFIEMADCYLGEQQCNLTKKSLSYNLLIFNWVSTCLLNKYAKLSYSNREAWEIYEKARRHPVFQRAVKMCMHNHVGIRRKVFAWFLTNSPRLYKRILIFAVWIKNKNLVG